MVHRPQKSRLVRIRPRWDSVYVSHGRTVLACDLDGRVRPGAQQGLFVDSSRLISRLDYFIGASAPQLVAGSPVEQHSWMGYYGVCVTDDGTIGESMGTASNVVELVVRRTVLEGMHEDLDLTNYSNKQVSFELRVALEADFRDMAETPPGASATDSTTGGELHRQWRRGEDGDWELGWRYRARHRYDHQGHQGVASIHRGMRVRVANADSEPRFDDGCIVFEVTLPPHTSWHSCLKFAPDIDGDQLHPPEACPSFADEPDDERLRSQMNYVVESTEFLPPASEDLSTEVFKAIDRAKRDLASMRLQNFSESDDAWITAAGVPKYIGLFGRDVLTCGWQSAISSPEISARHADRPGRAPGYRRRQLARRATRAHAPPGD